MQRLAYNVDRESRVEEYISHKQHITSTAGGGMGRGQKEGGGLGK